MDSTIELSPDTICEALIDAGLEAYIEPVPEDPEMGMVSLMLDLDPNREDEPCYLLIHTPPLSADDIADYEAEGLIPMRMIHFVLALSFGAKEETLSELQRLCCLLSLSQPVPGLTVNEFDGSVMLRAQIPVAGEQVSTSLVVSYTALIVDTVDTCYGVLKGVAQGEATVDEMVAHLKDMWSSDT